MTLTRDMNSFGSVPFQRTVWRTACFALWLAFSGTAFIDLAPLALAVEGGQQAQPPVPFYSAHVTKTTVVGPGMIIINTNDSFDTVLDWYRTNLKDQDADVALGPEHDHFLTHNGAGVDVLADGTGGNAGTTISLLWNSGGHGSREPQPSSHEASDAPTANGDPKADGETPATQTQDNAPNAATPEAKKPDLIHSQVEPIRIEPLKLHPAKAQVAMVEPPKLLPTEVEPMQVEPPTVATTKNADRSPRSGAQIAESPGLEFFRAGRYAEALLAWQDAASAGNVDAPLFIGMMFDAGQGVPQSYSDALSWYRMAAEKGSPTASFNVGVMYDAGFGVTQDTTEASEWYSRAAAKGIGRAAFNLALLFERGDGVPQDDESAKRYFRQAERLGVRAARSHLRKSVLDSASTDDADLAFNTVHVIASEAPKSGSANVVTATERTRRLADKGDPAAQYDLAYCLENGIGIGIDLREAYAMYREAAAETDDSRLRAVAEAGASQVKAHLLASQAPPSARGR